MISLERKLELQGAANELRHEIAKDFDRHAKDVDSVGAMYALIESRKESICYDKEEQAYFHDMFIYGSEEHKQEMEVFIGSFRCSLA